ncbi:MAG: Outer rane efflux protein [Rhodocyclaceae bacterium]|nr:Outer rane efflux protein [Rhodocyclaceae bacterium]
MKPRYRLASLLFLLAGLASAQAEHTLDDLLRQARESNRSLLAGREQVEVSRAAVSTAGAFPNPELEIMAGPARARGPGANPGDTRSIALTQPIDLPGRRGPRIAAAAAGLDAAQAGLVAFEADLVARLRVQFYELLRREAELKAAREDRKLMEDIHSRIALRVETGEAARYELIKADAEMLNAQKSAQAAALRVEQARSSLRRLVGPALPASFSVKGDLDAVPVLAPLAALQAEVGARNPELARARAEARRAEGQLAYERAQRWPTLALKASRDEDPDLRTSRLGLAVSLPLWDRRDGPVGEAVANLSRSRHELAEREFSLAQSLQSAYQQYEIAQTQVTALESGIVRQAESALKAAEAAYRFGERGILEVLDAQRVYRAARNELITARFELAAAWAEIERLRALPQP